MIETPISKRSISVISSILLSFLCIVGSITAANDAFKHEGYKAIVPFQDKFLAVGSDGRMDWISNSGTVIKSDKMPAVTFRCLATTNQTIVAAGNKGNLFISPENGKFQKVESGTDKTIFSLTFFNNKIVAGCEQGMLLIGDEKGIFKEKQLELKGNIVSLSSRSSDCYGVTDAGEIIHTTDGTNWIVFNYNEFYSGFYLPCSFTKVFLTDDRITIAGSHTNGTPVLLFSSQGNVWTERTLNYTTEDNQALYLTEIPNDISYNLFEDLIILVCSVGKMMTIPSCSHCNKLVPISTESLDAVAQNEKIMMIVGENYFIKAITK
jgi:hypothetical protein